MAEPLLTEATDPRRALLRRQLEAGAQAASQAATAQSAQQAAAPAPAPGGPQFTRQWMPQERALQMQKLAAMLRDRPAD